MLLLYDRARLSELLQSFYTLTQIRIVIFDEQLHKMAEVPAGDSRFCTLIRRHPAAEEKCRASDRYACAECKKTDRLYSYTCHAGLTEAVAPIRHGSMVIGYIMFGQVLRCDDAERYWPSVWTRCRDYGVTQEALREAYAKKTAIDMERLSAAAQILEACASYLWLRRSIALREDDLPRRLETYLSEHLEGDLSAAALCAQFGISRSKLYRLLGAYYGKGLEQLVREKRVERAQQLLDSTGLSVREVAALVGYADYNYFIKVFKRATGSTPGRYGK